MQLRLLRWLLLRPRLPPILREIALLMAVLLAWRKPALRSRSRRLRPRRLQRVQPLTSSKRLLRRIHKLHLLAPPLQETLRRALA